MDESTEPSNLKMALKAATVPSDPTLSVPCSHGSLYGTKEKVLVATSTTA